MDFYAVFKYEPSEIGNRGTWAYIKMFEKSKRRRKL